MAPNNGRALGRRWATVPIVGGGERGQAERLLWLDPGSGQMLDLGPVKAACRKVTLTCAASQGDAQAFDVPDTMAFLILSVRTMATDPRYAIAHSSNVSNIQERPWQNQAIRGELWAPGGLPRLELWTPDGRGPGPQLLPPRSKLQVVAQDLSAAPNVITEVIEGIEIPADRADFVELYRTAAESLFILAGGFTVPAGVNAVLEPPAKFQSLGDGITFIHYMRAFEAAAAPAIVPAGWNLNLRGINEGRQWFDTYTPVELVIGDNLNPGGLTLSRDLARGEDLEVSAQNRTAGAIVVTQLAMFGSKSWR